MYTGLGDRVDNLNEELLRTKEIMGLLTEKTSGPPGVFHDWKECGSGGGYSYNLTGVLFWVNGPGWNVGTQTGGSPTYPWATHQNSAQVWTFFGQPSPGTVVGFELPTIGGNTLSTCLEYIGTVQSGNYLSPFSGPGTITNVTTYTADGCGACLNIQEPHSCIGSYCLPDPNGPHATLADCQDCFNDPQCPCSNLTWDCIKTFQSWEAPLPDEYDCVSNNTRSGQFTSKQDCLAAEPCSQPSGPLLAKDKANTDIDGLNKVEDEDEPIEGV